MKRLFFIAGLTLCSASGHAAVGDTVNEAGVYIADGISVSSIGTGYLQTDKINSTRFYDSTKGAEWTGSPIDSNMCWLHSSANLIQYWQSYYGVFAKPQTGAYIDPNTQRLQQNKIKPLPYGTIGTENASSTDPTQVADKRRLEVARDIYLTYRNNTGGIFSWAAEWYFRGAADWPDNGNWILINLNTGGYYANYFGTGEPFKTDISYTTVYCAAQEGTTLDKVSTTGTPFGNTDTAAVKNLLLQGFGVNNGVQTESGKIVYLSTTNSVTGNGHALTCYGFTTHEDGTLKSILIADNNDNINKYNSALRELFVKVDNNRLELYTDTTFSSDSAFMPSGSGVNYISSISYINTPEVLKNMLTEYSDVANEAQVWNGKGTAWEQQSATTEELPTESTGWDVHVNGTNIATEHHGYYHTYLTDGRAVRFDNHAADDKRTVTINGTVAASSIEIAANGYVFQAGNNAAIKEGADMTVRSGASLKSGVQLTLKNLTLEAGAGLQATAPIVVTGDFTASTAGQTRTTDTPQANVHSVLDLSQADSLTMQAIVNMNGKDLYLSAEPLKIFINPADAGKAEIVCFTGIGNLYLENRITENYCLKADVSYVGLDPETLLQYQLMYNQQLRTLTLVQSVPEPTTATLSLLALAALVGRRRRR